MYHHIKALIARVCELSEECPIVLEKPKKKDLGHLATPLAFSLAKVVRANPHIIAQDLAAKLTQCQEFTKVEAINGFVNLTLSEHFLHTLASRFLNVDKSIKVQNTKVRETKILLEFVSANPTGPLHIGHARGAVYGDTLARIGRFLGYDIQTEYYINDAGAQIATLGLSLLLCGQEHILGWQVEYPQSYYKGEYIVDLAQACAKAFGEDVFKSEDSIPTLAEFGKNAMMKVIKDNLALLDIEFNHFVSEKALYERWQNTLNTLKAHNGIYESDGKIWIESSKLGDEKNRVLVRENGEPTYLAGDIIYHQDKFLRPFTHYINIWGADHHGYIARVKAAIHFLGFDENKLEVLLSQMVSLLKDGQPYKMSKRAGNFILMSDVVEDIGADALRFVFISKKLDTHLEFDVDTLKKQDMSNPIYYIHYANARIHTLFERAGVDMQGFDFAMYTKNSVSLNDDAKALLFEALCMPHVIESSFNERELHKLCDYLYQLSSYFHAFYNAHRILQTPQQEALLYVLKVVSHSITLGLSLLGITAKIKM